MSTRSQRLSLFFSCVGHAYIHLFTAFYFVIVLAIEVDWALPYHELIELWTLGALLVGLGALPAGWLGDRWSAAGMMVVFFIGLGLSSVYAAFAPAPSALLIGLAGIGLFAAIYHPVGIAWLVRNSGANRGKLLGLNGIFGGVGVAGAALVAGALIDLSGWRAAFLVPGIVSIVTGLALWLCLWLGWVREDVSDAPEEEAQSRGDMARVFAVLLLTMFMGAIIYQANQTAMPKLFSLRLGDFTGEGVFGVGAIVAGVYLIAAFTQLLGGHLADRYSLKWVYAGAYVLQAPFLFVIAGMSGLPLVVAALFMISFNAGALPAENMLLARYAPQKHHSLAFGAKFVLFFGSGPLALLLVSRINEATGGFFWLYIVLASLGLLGGAVCIILPRPRRQERLAAAPAE